MLQTASLSEELVGLKEERGWTWREFAFRFSLVLNEQCPSATSLFRYAKGTSQPTAEIERTLFEAIERMRMPVSPAAGPVESTALAQELLFQSQENDLEAVENALSGREESHLANSIELTIKEAEPIESERGASALDTTIIGEASIYEAPSQPAPSVAEEPDVEQPSAYLAAPDGVELASTSTAAQSANAAVQLSSALLDLKRESGWTWKQIATRIEMALNGDSPSGSTLFRYAKNYTQPTDDVACAVLGAVQAAREQFLAVAAKVVQAPIITEVPVALIANESVAAVMDVQETSPVAETQNPAPELYAPIAQAEITEDHAVWTESLHHLSARIFIPEDLAPSNENIFAPNALEKPIIAEPAIEILGRWADIFQQPEQLEADQSEAVLVNEPVAALIPGESAAIFAAHDQIEELIIEQPEEFFVAAPPYEITTPYEIIDEIEALNEREFLIAPLDESPTAWADIEIGHDQVGGVAGTELLDEYDHFFAHTEEYPSIMPSAESSVSPENSVSPIKNGHDDTYYGPAHYVPEHDELVIFCRSREIFFNPVPEEIFN